MTDYRYKSRTFLELCVAKKFSLHVVLHLRRDDISWFQSNLASHEQQVLNLIKEEIVPKEFPFLISESRHTTPPGVAPSGKGQKRKKGIRQPVIGSAHLRQKQKRRAATNNKNLACNNGKSNPAPPSLPLSVATEGTEVEAAKGKRGVYTPDVSMIFGETLQITYKTEEISQASVTLRFGGGMEELVAGDQQVAVEAKSKGRKRNRPSQPPATKMIKLATFQQSKTLPKRIICWCYPFEIEDPMSPNPLQGGGFPRPETIPMSSLFVKPSAEEAMVNKK
jgi:hypothetical protein